MKKITFIFLSLALIFVSCDPKKDDPRVFDANAKILIRPAKGVKLRSSDNPEHLTALEIVKQTTNLKVTYKGKIWGRGFSEEQRDYDIPALKMFSTDIIFTDGSYVPDFIEATDCILQRKIQQDPVQLYDTIAYIPNATLRAAQVAIKKAYDAENYDEVYRLFDQAFTFIPITGSEWRALKAAGNQ